MRIGRNRHDWEAILQFYEEGHTVRECANRFGFSNGAWHHAVKRGAIARRDALPSKPRGATRRQVQRLLGLGLTQIEIARELGVSKPTVCFHVRNLGIPAQTALAKRFDAIARGAIVPRPRLEPIEDMLAAGRRRNPFHVKQRLLLAGVKEARCERCGLTDWQSQPTETWGGRNKGRLQRSAVARS